MLYNLYIIVTMQNITKYSGIPMGTRPQITGYFDSEHRDQHNDMSVMYLGIWTLSNDVMKKK